ncbi:hypothetical protein NDU88_006013 [Pleurodeles waltl]|uniref:Uncharacterized protein n=1 Tax=Pleurodeles waltl TaxID=8319 RepID=A0AAV7VNE9_PLEWA|nr:hypothetical protein NDU88_006013 [Pleurodeles waltl]
MQCADSLERRTEELGWAHVDLRPVVFGRVVVRPQEQTQGEIPQSIGAPLGAKTRLGARRARGLPVDSSERQAEELGRVRVLEISSD